MKSAIGRRQFVSSGLLLAGAALFWPARSGLFARTPAADGAAETDRAVLNFVRCYSGDAGIRSSGTAGALDSVTRIAARVTDIAAMQRALSGARAHGITRIQASGSIATFSLGGRRYEVDNIFAAAPSGTAVTGGSHAV